MLNQNEIGVNIRQKSIFHLKDFSNLCLAILGQEARNNMECNLKSNLQNDYIQL